MFSFTYMSDCGDNVILGGFGKFGNIDWGSKNTSIEKTFLISSRHFKVFFSYEFYKIDNWSTLDKVEVFFDNILI